MWEVSVDVGLGQWMEKLDVDIQEHLSGSHMF